MTIRDGVILLLVLVKKSAAKTHIYYSIYIVKKVCRKYAERKSLIPTFEMRTLKLKRSTQYCRLMAMRTIVGKPLDSTNNPRI